METQTPYNFESWYLTKRSHLPQSPSEWLFLKAPDGRYELNAVQDAWEAWQAALNSPAVQELFIALKELLDQDDHGEDEIWVRNKARAALAAMEL